MTKPPLFALTGLRVWLALWVVVFHQAAPSAYLGPWLSSLPRAVHNLLRTGYVAVGVFFVLSGFVLSYNYSLTRSWDRSQMRRFGLARFARIYPAYLLGLLVLAPLMWHERHRPVRDLIIAVMNATLVQAWLPQTAATWNGPGWSLSAEAFFYLVFPLVGVTLWRCRLWTMGMIWACAWVAPFLAWAFTGLRYTRATDLAIGDPFWAAVVTFNPLLRLPDFCLGILACRVFLRLRDHWQGHGSRWYVPALVIELLILSQADRLPLVFVSNCLLSPLHALLILGLALDGGWLARQLSTRVMVLLGNASYAMYILHVPILKWLNFTLQRLHQPLAGLGLMVGYVVLVVGVSIGVFGFIEEPITRGLKRQRHSQDSRLSRTGSGA